MPKVSVIVPVHNTAQYLTECVQSITAQTLKDLEIILVENASTDNSLELCLQIAATDERIKVLHIDHADLSTARNEGVRISTGEYVGFVDSDDTILPEMYEDMYTVAVTNNLGLVNCNFVRTFDKRKPKYLYPEDGKCRLLTAIEITSLNLKEEISRIVCTLLIKRDIFEFVTFPENMFHEDRASTHLFMAHCKQAANINKAYYLYYQHPKSITHTNTFRRYRDFVKATCERLKFIRDFGFYTNEEQCIIANKSANSLLRALRHMICLAKGEQEKAELIYWCKKTDLIPKGTMLSLKEQAIKWYIKKFVL